MPEEAERQFRTHRFYMACKERIVGRLLCLWPPEAVGGYLAQVEWARLMEATREAAMRDARERARDAGIVLPS